MSDTDILNQALAFRGHKCWASTAGVRLGLAAMSELGAERAGAKGCTRSSRLATTTAK